MKINNKLELRPLLSIVIPVFNRQVSLNDLLSDLTVAVVSGGFEAIVEVVVIDDCSTRPVVTPVFPYSVRLSRNQKNRGAPYSRQKGFGLTRGKFIHFHDSDDTVTNDWLKQILSVLHQYSDVDLLVTARIDRDKRGDSYRSQRYFNKQVRHPGKIKCRLTYRNCMGPLGGVTFSRHVLEGIECRQFSSCQDWQMYLYAIERSQLLIGCPEIKFIFNKTRGDRISHCPQKKILGHLQLSKLTANTSIFKKNIRLFYLYTCKAHIMKKRGFIFSFYKKNRYKIWLYFVVVSVYWRLT